MIENTSKPVGPRRLLKKDSVLESVNDGQNSAIRKYQDFFIGERKLSSLLRFELTMMVAGPMPGAVGYLFRKLLFRRLLKKTGAGVQWGRNVSFRHPGKIEIGDGTAVDDECLLDARGLKEGAIKIGRNVIIARGCLIQSKTDQGRIAIGDHCSIGGQCTLSSCGGILIGHHVGIGGNTYIGGGRYRTDRLDVPMMEQELYSEGVVEIGDDCWIGAGVVVLDGVRIGKGVVVGAGSVVNSDIPDFSVVAGNPPIVLHSRWAEDE